MKPTRVRGNDGQRMTVAIPPSGRPGPKGRRNDPAPVVLVGWVSRIMARTDAFCNRRGAHRSNDPKSLPDRSRFADPTPFPAPLDPTLRTYSFAKLAQVALHSLRG